MKKRLIQYVSLILSAVLLVTFLPTDTFKTSAATASQLNSQIAALEKQSQELEKEINKLQGQINAQVKLKKAVEQKIAVVQQQINLCNSEIAKLNDEISKNNAAIKKSNEDIEADKLSFKKRLRAIYMTNSGNNLQILLGADNFADFLYLAQLTSSMSAKDKKLIEGLIAEIKKLEKKQEENKVLLEAQQAVKSIVAAKQKELQAEGNKIQSLINSIDSDQSQLEATNKQVEADIKAYQKELASMTSSGGTSFVYDGGDFLWPVPGHYKISAYFQSNDSIHKGHHDGIDIAGSGIAGKPIVAISDGVIIKAYNSCTHNYGKNSSCKDLNGNRCGGGFGNYVRINHGTKDGKTYVVTYAHMSSAAITSGTVKKGQTIGYVGTTGWSTGYHLHFGIAVNGVWKDPFLYYKKV